MPQKTLGCGRYLSRLLFFRGAFSSVGGQWHWLDVHAFRKHVLTSHLGG